MVRIVAVVLSVYVLFYIGGGFTAFTGGIEIGRFISGVALGVLVLTFAIIPATKKAPKDRIPWYDWLGIIIIVGYCSYRVIQFDSLLNAFFLAGTTVWDLIAIFPFAICVLEAVRRSVGATVLFIIIPFAIYPFIGNIMPGILATRAYTASRWAEEALVGGNGMWGIAFETFGAIIAGFLIFAQILTVAGAGDFLVRFANSLVGRFRGGAAKMAVLASGFLGSVVGSSTANVASTGSVTIPLMKRVGYKPVFAGAVEAVASNGALIMPPVMGAVAFVMAEFLGVRYIEVCFHALLPALLYYLAVFIQVDREAVIYGLQGLPPSERPPVMQTLRQGWVYLLPLFVLVFFLAVLAYSPGKSAFYAIVATVVVSLFQKETRTGLRKLLLALENASYLGCLVGPICLGVGFILGSLTLTGLALKLSSGLIDLAGGSIFILLMLAGIACFILGMGTGAITCYITLATLVAPALIMMGVSVWTAHFFILFAGITSYITPPSAIVAYTAASIAEAPPMKTAWLATRLGILTFLLPFLFVYNPALLLIGSAQQIAFTVVFSIIGCFIAGSALEGYLITRLTLWQRIPLIVAGLALLSGNEFVVAIAGGAILIMLAPQIISKLTRRVG